MTFVRTKLMIEAMAPGDVAEVRLKGREPLENVPRSVAEHGHTVLALEPLESGDDPYRPHRLILRKEAAS